MLESSLISVNVGTPRSLVWRGREITTSIFKSPVAGRVAVHGVNVQGDDQADRSVHGGADMALYAYASEDYAWWESQLGAALEPGHFGNNLTTRGLDVSGAVVGERWRIGTVRLEVASPRIPCYKLGMRMGDPGFVKRFAAANRPGAYLRILEPGEIGAGDPVVVEDRPGKSISVAEFFELYFSRGPRLAALLDVERLPQTWRSWLEETLARA